MALKCIILPVFALFIFPKTLFVLRKVEYNTVVQTNDHLYATEQKMYKDFRHVIKIQKK